MENINIVWVEKSGKKFLKIIFEESLDRATAEKVIPKFKDELDLFGNEKITLIWDCLKMKGYENDASMLWKDALVQKKNQIQGVWLITTSNIIRMGALMVSLMMPFKLKTVKDESEIVVD